jgi:Holliday junction resolvase RusA-like endonuclease
MLDPQVIREVWAGDATVYGPPQAMGNKTAFIGKKTGRAHIRETKSVKLRSFQHEMKESMRECAPDSPLLGPVSVMLIMVMRRPNSHFGTGKNAAILKASAPRCYCQTKPDVDKVLRAVLDCGTGIWWRDDSQVCAGGYVKRYAGEGEEEHVLVEAHELGQGGQINSAIISSKLSVSTQFLKLGNDAALLFLMGLPHCDDYGRISADPGHWVLKVCPGRFLVRQIAALLSEIESATDAKGEPLITPYEVDGECFYFVVNWFKYQNFRHDYIVRASCPHPVMGITEPAVQAKTLSRSFGRMLFYNRLSTEVEVFLAARESREKHGKSRDNPEDSRDCNEDRAEDARIEEASARQSREKGKKGRDLGPSSASASASASATATASASAPATATPPASTARPPSGSAAEQQAGQIGEGDGRVSTSLPGNGKPKDPALLEVERDLRGAAEKGMTPRQYAEWKADQGGHETP